MLLSIKNFTQVNADFIQRLFAHSDDADIDEPFKPDTECALGLEQDKTPGNVTIHYSIYTLYFVNLFIPATFNCFLHFNQFWWSCVYLQYVFIT